MTSEADQAAWVERLVREATALDMPFVTWWSNHDLMPLEIAGSCLCESADPWCDFLEPFPADLRLLYQFFGSMGLRDDEGTPREAHRIWSAALER